MATGTRDRTRGLVAALTAAFLAAGFLRAGAQSLPFVLRVLPDKGSKAQKSTILKFQDSLAALAWIDNQLRGLWQQGFLNTELHATRRSADTLEIGLLKGHPNRNFILITPERRMAMRYSVGALYARYVMPYLQREENSGFPFSQFWVDSLRTSLGAMEVFGRWEKGPRIYFDSISVAGSAQVSPRFLEAYLGIRKGSPYREKIIRAARQRLERLPFATAAEPAKIYFVDSLARIRVLLNKRPCSSVYGFLGIAPASPFNARLLLMGEARLQLYHALGFGESVDLEWRRLQVRTQSLRAGLAWPYIFNTPLGLDGRFDYYRKDSSFQNIQLALGIRYLFPGQNYLRFSYQRFISQLIERSQLSGLKTLPQAHDVTMNLASLGVHWHNTDNLYNPGSGFIVEGEASAGLRNMPRLPELPDTLYRGTPLKAPFWNSTFRAESFLGVVHPWVLRLALAGGLVGGPAVFQNQLYRLGGLRQLRGFNEESLFASRFGVLTVEPRLRFERQSFICLFANGGLLKYQNGVYAWPLGFGAGGALNTKAGQLELYYAYGVLQGAPLRWREPRIHVAYRALF
ncbi:MAG: BamA/TamA family outer membrane protein [Flavobacteriales bacterium]|nr:BamA/TamA family outer membrane protein [Flavobacteriales bacterium]MCX7648946.1 BamA/TamA family outer membrane protein [Flavobacteriales bacterium]MDW8432587.1 BamA/TamA family outer membrane protein [Flavobacteriales bacterium]